MAFVTMIFAYMVIAGIIALVIAGTISTIGLIVLIVSLIRRHRAKVRGEKPKKFGLIAGWILFLVPIVVIAGFIIYYLYATICEWIDFSCFIFDFAKKNWWFSYEDI